MPNVVVEEVTVANQSYMYMLLAQYVVSASHFIPGERSPYASLVVQIRLAAVHIGRVRSCYWTELAHRDIFHLTVRVVLLILPASANQTYMPVPARWAKCCVLCFRVVSLSLLNTK